HRSSSSSPCQSLGLGIFACCESRQPICQLIEPPLARQQRCFFPCWRLIAQRRQRSGGIHGRYLLVAEQLLGLAREATFREHRLDRTVFPQQARRSFWPDTVSAREFVGGITAKRDEIWYLFGLDPIPLAHFPRTDTGELARAHGLNDGGLVRSELEGVAVAAGDKDGSAAPLFCGCGAGEEIVRLVARRLGIGKTARTHQKRQIVELFQQLIVDR